MARTVKEKVWKTAKTAKQRGKQRDGNSKKEPKGNSRNQNTITEIKIALIS